LVAIKNGDSDIKGADIHHTTNENVSVLDITIQYEHKEIADYLEGLGVKRSFGQGD
jgi:hypothetical protein